MMTDPIADMLTRIRNGLAVRKETISLPYSSVKFKIAEILAKEGYIEKVEKNEIGKFLQLDITLKYVDDQPKIAHIKRVSKPGRRIYRKYNELPIVLNNFGFSIISTSKGLLTNKDARVKKVGGEILCEIY